MKYLLVTLLLAISGCNVFSQYHVVYYYTHFDKNTGDVRELIEGIDVYRQDYYIMEGYTKSVKDTGEEWIFTYQSSDNLCSVVNINGEITSMKSKNQSLGLQKIVELDTTVNVLGYSCKAAKLIYPDFTAIFYYSEDIRVDPASFKGHNFGDYHKVWTALGGAVPLQFSLEAENYSFLATAELVETVKLDEDDFDPKKAFTELRQQIDSTTKTVIEASKKVFLKYPKEPVTSVRVSGSAVNGQFSMPVVIDMKVPNYMLITLQFESAKFQVGVNDKYRWNYNPLVDKVERQMVGDQVNNTDNIMEEFPPMINEKWYDFKIISVIETDSLYRFVLNDEHDNRKVFYVDTKDYLIRRWGNISFYYLLNDYGVFEGLPFPTSVAQMEYGNDNPKFKANFTEIQLNVNLPKSIFEIPENLKDRVVDKKFLESDQYYYKKGEEFLGKEQYDSAIFFYKEAIKLNPNNKFYYNQSGVAKLQQGDYYAAIADLSRSIELDEHYHTAWYNLGLAKMNLGDYERAINDFSQAIVIAPFEPMYHSEKGLCYYELGKYDSALSNFDQVIELDSSSGVHFWNVAMANYQLGNYKRALEDFTKSEQLQYVNDDLYNYRGICYFNAEDYRSALNDFVEATKSDSPTIDYFSNLGSTYSRLGESKKAIESFELALELDSTSAEVYNLIGLELYNDGSYSAAVTYFSKAIKHNPNEAVYYDNRASAKESMLNYTGAIEDYSQSLSLYPNDADIYLKRGLAKVNINDKFDACRDFKKAVELGSKKATESIEEFCH